MNIPLMLSADAYSITSNIFASNEAKQRSVYNYTQRYSPANAKSFDGIAKDSRMIFWGLSQFIDKYLRNPITAHDVLEAADFMRDSHSFGHPSNFDVDLWIKVVKKYGGYLPLQIEAIAEGSVFFPNEPVIQVTSLDNEFGEICATIEARLVGMVSIGSTAATLCRHWRNHFENQGLSGIGLDYFIHNFSARGCATEEEDILTGVAHLLSFNGTDNFTAAYYARKAGLPAPIGTSISALAHRNVQAHMDEVDAFEAILENNEIASCVADCYNYANAVDVLTNIALKRPEKIVVIRPDSGDHVETIVQIIQACKDKQLFTTVNGTLLPKNVKFISGDSMTPTKVDEVLDKVEEMTGNRFAWGIFGVGGYLVNSCTRDTLSAAYKLSSKGKGNIPVVKLSETKGKLSVPGPNYIADTKFKCEPRVAISNGWPINSLMKPYYQGSPDWPLNGLPVFWKQDSLSIVRERTIEDFKKWDSAVAQNPTFGLERSSLSADIKSIQDSFYEKYRSV